MVRSDRRNQLALVIAVGTVKLPSAAVCPNWLEPATQEVPLRLSAIRWSWRDIIRDYKLHSRTLLAAVHLLSYDATAFPTLRCHRKVCSRMGKTAGDENETCVCDHRRTMDSY
jgi:hypothetical protein